MTQTSPGRARSVRVALPPCNSGLGPGTEVLTTDGVLPVEFLSPGDRIITRDRGAVRLAHLFVRKVPRGQMLRLRPGELDPGDDTPDVLISAETRMVVRGWRARVLFGKPAALVSARRLIDGAYIARLDGPGTTRLFQLGFSDGQHLLQIAAGQWQVASARAPQPVTVRG